MQHYRRVALHRRVIVNLKTGRAIRGILLNERGPLLELAECELLEVSRQPVKMDGTTVIERSNVDFVQVAGEVG